jgi:hypothetical protein
MKGDHTMTHYHLAFTQRSLLYATMTGFVLVLLIFVIAGCEKTTTVTGDGTGEGNDLINPAIQPKVLATYPENNSIGPFNLYDGSNYFKPHFVVQMNKLINLITSEHGTVQVSGFDRPVIAYIFRDYYPLFGKTTSPYDDILAYVIYDSLDGNKSLYRIGTIYTVTIDPTLEDINGNHLGQRFEFSFLPEPYFRVVQTYPGNGSTDFPILGQMNIQFNSTVDTSIFSHLEISPPVIGRWKVDCYDTSRIVFEKQTPFPYNSTFSTYIHAGAHDTFGRLLHQPYSFTFTTTPFKVTSYYPRNQGKIYTQEDIWIYFSGTIDTASARAAFTIAPPNGGTLLLGFEGLKFSPYPEFLPDTQYEVTIGTNLKSTDGTHLAVPLHFSFTTYPLQ